jgi:hypothetical protein
VSQYAVGYIGVSIEINIFANIVIDGWTVTEATKETISQVGEETVNCVPEDPTSMLIYVNCARRSHFNVNLCKLCARRSHFNVNLSLKTLTCGIFFNIEYSWSIQTGLSLYFDGNLVAETKTYISREVTVSQYAVGYIGVSIEINIFANIVIDGWTVT